MFIGQFGLDGLIAYTPWMPRGGDKGVFVCEALDRNANATLDIDIQHKNTDEPDSSASTVASFTQITSVGVAVKEATAGFKELVRLKIMVGSNPTTFDAWILFDIMAPSWRKN